MSSTSYASRQAQQGAVKQQQQQQQQRRPSSLHSSPGSSRPSSPQISMHQKRKSSHYPPNSNIGRATGQSGYRNEQHQHHQAALPRPNSSEGQSHQHQHRTSLSSMHYTNNAKRQIQQPSQQHKQQQFAATRTYSNEQAGSSTSKMGLPAPGFSSRLPMGTSQRSN